MSKIIQTPKGLLEGLDMGEYTVFKGIPYAKAPTGSLRWKAPKETEPWEGVKKADAFGNCCVQDLPSRDVPYMARYYKEFYSDPLYTPGTSELWYVHGTLGRCWRPMTEEDAALSREMAACWTNFIKTGNPNGDGVPEWKPYQKTQLKIRIF